MKTYIAKDVKNADVESTKCDSNICHICGETDHVTAGPNYTKVVQYFACKDFVEMSPAQRYQTLRRKGLCHQCLFPGASAQDEKHRKGRCQRDFTCKHPSHQKYPSKKHSLASEEHKDAQDNKDLLETYKSRCILREKINLPDFSKNIKLSFFC